MLNSNLKQNETEIIRLYNEEGYGRVKISRMFNATVSETRKFLRILVNRGVLNASAKEKHRANAGHNNGDEHRFQEKPSNSRVKNNVKWASEHSREIINYFKQGKSKADTMKYFGISTCGISKAAINENCREAGYPSSYSLLGFKWEDKSTDSPFQEVITNNLQEPHTNNDGFLPKFIDELQGLLSQVDSLKKEAEELRKENNKIRAAFNEYQVKVSETLSSLR